MNFKLLILCFLWSLDIQAQFTATQYPDLIVEAHYANNHPDFNQFYGGNGLNYPVKVSVESLLNPNNSTFVSLPKGSYIVFKFTDNVIVNAQGQDDIIITEHGCCTESVKNGTGAEQAAIYVGRSLDKLIYLGTVNDCGKNTLDLESIGFNGFVKFIKIVGLDYKCSSPGFDLVSIKALPKANKNVFVGMANAENYFTEPLQDVKLLLDKVYFDNDSYTLTQTAKKALDDLVDVLKKHTEASINIVGHTDNRASNAYNQTLSYQRAKAVQSYFTKNGISKKRLNAYGKGEITPLKSNRTANGRSINRRVEIFRTK